MVQAIKHMYNSAVLRLGWHLWPLTITQGVTFLFTLDRSLMIHLQIMKGTMTGRLWGGMTASAGMARILLKT